MRPTSASLVLALAACSSACRNGGSDHAARASGSAVETALQPAVTGSASGDAPASKATGAPAPIGSPTTKLVRCGWGAVSAGAGPDALPWAIALVDVELPEATRSLRVTAIELGGERGVAAKMGDRATLRVQEGALGFSFAAAGTRELGETLAAGPSRLRAAAVLDRVSKQVAQRKPTTCSVVLTDDTGRSLVATGNADPQWQNE